MKKNAKTAKKTAAKKTSSKKARPMNRRIAKAVAAKFPTCTCGCGQATKGGDWAPGHDARGKAALRKKVGDAEFDRLMKSLGSVAAVARKVGL